MEKNQRKFMASTRRLAMMLVMAIGSSLMALSASAENTVLAVQQQGDVKGTVTDSNGETIIGATVRVLGTQNAAITDIDGNFTVKANPGQTLEISYIGCKTVRVKASNQPLKIVLEDDSKTLNEVVVVGYGTMRKKDLTGSVVQIKPEKLADQNPGSVQDLLRGTPGLQIGFDSSAKGSGASIQLRGQNSLYTEGSHNSPLIILDGMQFNGELSEINPDDIGQIDVLKDASSAAIYGAKAASGVIIITTKKGKVGKPVINLTANFGANTRAQYRDVFNATEYMKYREDWFKSATCGYREDGTYGYYGIESKIPFGYYDHYNNLGQYGISSDEWAKNGPKTLGDNESLEALYARRMGLDGDCALLGQNYLAGKIYDWKDATYQTGLTQDYNASVSGATDNFNYYLSFGYLNKEGAIQGDEYKAYRASMKMNAKITDWLEIGANVNFQDRNDVSSAVPLGSNYWDNNQLRESPFSQRYDENGQEMHYPRSGNPTNGGYNYHYLDQYDDLEKGYTVLNTIFNAKLTLPYGFTYQFNIAPRYQWFYDRYFMSSELPDSDPSTRGVNRNTSKKFEWSLNNTITWDKTFDKHHFTVTLVQEAEENRTRFMHATSLLLTLSDSTMSLARTRSRARSTQTTHTLQQQLILAVSSTDTTTVTCSQALCAATVTLHSVPITHGLHSGQ